MTDRITNYADKFTSIYNNSPCYGDSLTNILEEINQDNGFWQPSPGPHSIPEIISHGEL